VAGSARPPRETIHLSSRGPNTPWHELGHAAHARLLAARGQRLAGGQQEEQEVVAELVAATIARLTGRPAESADWSLH